MIRPSNHVGLHPQMAHYDVQASDGSNIGLNTVSTAAPGETRRYTWFAGAIEPPLQNCEYDFDDKDYDYLRYFGMPFQGVTLSSVDLFDSMNRDRFFESINTLLDYKIHRKFRNVVSSDVFDEYKDIGKFYYAWREDEGLMRSFRTAIGNRNFASNLFGDVIEFVDKGYEVLWAKGARIYNDNLLNESCKNRISEIFNGDDAVLFDRGKIAYAMKEIAECRGRTPETTQISRNTTRLFPIEKYIKNGKQDECNAHFVSIESGASNITPPDRIKQGQKGAIGALIVEPEGSIWKETEKIVDRQQHPNAQKINLRYTRSMADVVYPTDKGERRFRDLVLVHQKGLNLRYKDGSAVQNIAAERERAEYKDPNHPDHPLNTAPEDAHDSGHMAINYGAEPMWFRFGLPPDAPFGKSGFGGADSAWQAFSNDCCSNGKEVVTAHIEEDGVFRIGSRIGTVISADQPVGEPYVPIMKAYAGHEMRIRALMPTGIGRGSVVELHGHGWMRDPYLAEHVEEVDYVDHLDKDGNPVIKRRAYPRGGNQLGFYDKKGDFHPGWGTPSKCIGENALAMHLGGQESLTPMAHFDLIFPRAGGKHGVTGDFLWRDHAGFGITNGLWAIIRVEDAPKEYTDLHKDELFAPEFLRTNCNFVVADSNTTVQ